jgi:hypothetical protein
MDHYFLDLESNIRKLSPPHSYYLREARYICQGHSIFTEQHLELAPHHQV